MTEPITVLSAAFDASAFARRVLPFLSIAGLAVALAVITYRRAASQRQREWILVICGLACTGLLAVAAYRLYPVVTGQPRVLIAREGVYCRPWPRPIAWSEIWRLTHYRDRLPGGGLGEYAARIAFTPGAPSLRGVPAPVSLDQVERWLSQSQINEEDESHDPGRRAGARCSLEELDVPPERAGQLMIRAWRAANPVPVRFKTLPFLREHADCRDLSGDDYVACRRQRADR